VILEHCLPTTPRGIHEVFSRIPRSRTALETGTHSPWVSRQLAQLGHEVIVARLARIDPGLLGPVRRRSNEELSPGGGRAKDRLLDKVSDLYTLQFPAPSNGTN
jgi:hypothetical protein